MGWVLYICLTQSASFPIKLQGFMQIQSFAQLIFFVLFLFASLGQAIAQEDIKKFIERMNLQKQWDELVPYVRTKMTEKLSLTKDSTREKDNLQSTLNAPYFRGVLYRLVTGGYTEEYIENLTRMGLPVLDIMYSLVGDARRRSILTANLIVIGLSQSQVKAILGVRSSLTK
jgi:hypothetical protein